jgi:hypothetical protein
MAELQDIVAYLLAKYPHKLELSNARVTKMVYLGDWRHSLTQGRQISNIQWVFDNYGPFVWDVKRKVEENPFLFDVESTATMYGNPKTLLKLKDSGYQPQLAESERLALDHIIKITAPLAWDRFIGLVYSTYPILHSDRFANLNLVRLAAEYKAKAAAAAAAAADPTH